MTAKIFVMLKKAVLDPQGRAVQQSLNRLGFPEANDVRVGRFIELTLDAKATAGAKPASKDEARKRVEAMCKKLLANPVIEDYRIEIED